MPRRTSTENEKPRCVLNLWEENIESQPGLADFIAKMILAKPQRVNEFTALATLESSLRKELRLALSQQQITQVIERIEALSQLFQMTGRRNELIPFYDEIVAMAQSEQNLPLEELDQLAQRLAAMYRSNGNERDAFLVEFSIALEPLTRRPEALPAHFVRLRVAAYEAYRLQHYAPAIQIYRFLISGDQERAGTRSHLARALLTTGEYPLAMQETDLGLQIAAEEPTEQYVHARLWFLKALLQTLLGAEPGDALEQLAKLSTGCINQWLFRPMLESARPNLTPESYEYFTALALSLGGIGE